MSTKHRQKKTYVIGDTNTAVQQQVPKSEDNKQENSSSNEMIKEQQQQSVLVLINPHSGQGKSVSIYDGKILPFLKAHNVEHHTFITNSDSRVFDYIRAMSLAEILNLKSIVVVSGDGLFYETVNALMSRPDWEQTINVPIGVIPTGSGNGLAYTLIRQNYPNLMDTNEIIKICCQQVIQDETCMTDLVKITYGPASGSTIWSFLSIGWGLLADIDIDSEWLRSLGELRFTIYGLLRSVTSASYRGKLSYQVAILPYEEPDNDIDKAKADDGTAHNVISIEKTNIRTNGSGSESHDTNDDNDEEWTHIEDRFACLYAVYQSHISSVANFSPKSTLTDQLIYLTYIRGRLSPCRAVEFMLAIKDGSHENLPYVTVVPVKKFTLQPLEESRLVVDGEVIPWHLSDGPITAQVVPQVLKLLWNPKQN